MTVHNEMSFVEGFAEQLSATAEWRREKAIQYPHDSRNLMAGNDWRNWHLRL